MTRLSKEVRELEAAGPASRRWEDECWAREREEELQRLHIQLPKPGRLSRRNGAPLRYSRRPSRPMPSDAREFVRQLIDDLGLGSGVELVDYAFRVVAATGEADSWISEVRRARDAGALSPTVAHFLIRQLALSAMQSLSTTHPVLASLSDRIKGIERNRDCYVLESWANRAGPEEWESLCKEWDATHDALFTLLLKRHEEYEVLHGYFSGEEPFREGRRVIYGI